MKLKIKFKVGLIIGLLSTSLNAEVCALQREFLEDVGTIHTICKDSYVFYVVDVVRGRGITQPFTVKDGKILPKTCKCPTKIKKKSWF